MFVKRMLILTGLLAIFCTNSARSSESQYYVVKGGVSLGSYEAGINWALLQTLKDKKDQYPLRSFSGASAGAINALISAVDYCRVGNEDGLHNAFRDSWNLGLQQLLEGSDAKPHAGGLFERAALRAKVKALVDKIKVDSYRQDCELKYITFSVTRFVPEQEPEKGGLVVAKKMRFVVPLRVAIRNKTFRLQNAAIAHLEKEHDAIYLPTDGEGFIPLEVVAEAALASSAFPVAFGPIELSFCEPPKTGDAEADAAFSAPLKCDQPTTRKELFSDGGVFDNAPVGVAATLREQEGDHGSITLIDPSPVVPKSAPKTQTQQPGDARSPVDLGFADYAGFLIDALDISTSQLYWRAARKVDNFTFTDRHFPLMADYHAHFGAFYASDFRTHDYLVGVYDGFVNSESRFHAPSVNDQIASFPPGQEQDFLKFLAKCPKGCHIAGDEKNPFIVIQRAIQSVSSEGESGQASPAAGGDMFDILKKIAQNKTATFAQDTTALLDDPNAWFATNGKRIVTRTVAMQENAKSSGNAAIAGILKPMQPLVNAAIDRTAVGIWPVSDYLSVGPLSLGSVDYGIAFSEYAQVISWRPLDVKLFGNESFSPALSYHALSHGSDYFSGTVGWKHHRSSVVLSSLQGGPAFVHGGKRRLSIGFGALAETLQVYGHFDQWGAPKAVILQLDVTRAADMIIGRPWRAWGGSNR